MLGFAYLNSSETGKRQSKTAQGELARSGYQLLRRS